MDAIIIIGLGSSIITIVVFIFGKPFLKDFLKKNTIKVNEENETKDVLAISLSLKENSWKGVINTDMTIESGYRITSYAIVNGDVTIKKNSIFINKGTLNGDIINLGGDFINEGTIT